LQALADGKRLRILRLLLDRPRYVCELQAALGLAQPTVSKHPGSRKQPAGWIKSAGGETLSFTASLPG
jgi:predicted transcriptional regulator